MNVFVGAAAGFGINAAASTSWNSITEKGFCKMEFTGSACIVLSGTENVEPVINMINCSGERLLSA